MNTSEIAGYHQRNTNRYRLVCAAVDDNDSTYNAEWHDLWDGETATREEIGDRSPLMFLRDLMVDADADVSNLDAVIRMGERYDFGGHRYEFRVVER